MGIQEAREVSRQPALQSEGEGTHETQADAETTNLQQPSPAQPPPPAAPRTALPEVSVSFPNLGLLINPGPRIPLDVGEGRKMRVNM